MKPHPMKRITTPILVGSLICSVLLIVVLNVFVERGNVPPPAAIETAITVLGVVLLLTALAACTILAWRLKKRIGAQKFILLCGTVLFVLFGLFPPWLYTYDVTATIHAQMQDAFSFCPRLCRSKIPTLMESRLTRHVF